MMETTKPKSRKKVKGMTLAEVIIAMAVFAIAGTVMVQVGTASKSQLLNSNHMTTKTQVEVAVGTNDRAIDDLNDYGGNGEQEVEFNVGGFGTIDGKRYDTLSADGNSGKNCDTNLDANASLQFYKVG